MSRPYTTIDLRIHPLNKAAGAYPVEADLDDGGHFAGELHLDYAQLRQHEQAPLEYGLDLFDALFTGRIRRAYDQAAWRAEDETKGRLRVRLRIDGAAAELHAIPWERLYRTYRGEEIPLAATPKTPFSRYTPSPASDSPPLDERPIRLLFAIANPSNLHATTGLDAMPVEAEVEAMQNALGDLRGQDRYEVTVMPGCTGLPSRLAASLERDGYKILPGPTTLDALAGCRPGCHILHFLGHGVFQRTSPRGPGQAFLLLERDDGTADPLPDEVIVQKLASSCSQPALVFLGACESGRCVPLRAHLGLAPRLVAAGIPAVIAMQAPMPIAMAGQLAREFYHRLLVHGVVDRALNEARNFLVKPDDPVWSIPVLFTHLQDGQLVDVGPLMSQPVLEPAHLAGLKDRWPMQMDRAASLLAEAR